MQDKKSRGHAQLALFERAMSQLVKPERDGRGRMVVDHHRFLELGAPSPSELIQRLGGHASR